MKLKILFLAIIALSLVTAVYAQTPPMNVNGNVQIGGKAAADGLTLTIKVNNAAVRVITLSGGIYSADLRDQVEGSTVTFLIGSQKATQETVFEAGKIKTVDLTFSSFCGDTVCDSGESPSTCASDCGNTTPPPALIGGGGPPRRSSPSPTNGDGVLPPSDSKIDIVENPTLETPKTEEKITPSPITGGAAANPRIIDWKLASMILSGIVIAGVVIFLMRKH